MLRPLVLLSIAALVAMQPGRPRQGPLCLTYEPAPVTLRGRLETHTFAGPPNFESIRNGDKRVDLPVLVLARPVCINGDSASELNTERESGVREIQLRIPLGSDSLATLVRHLQGLPVLVTGTLSHAVAGGEYTKVIFTVSKLRAA